MLKNFVFAEISGSDIIENAAAGSSLISESFNELWQQTLNGGLYTAISSLGQMFAVATLVFFMVDLAKNWINGDDAQAFSNFIWPIIVICLLYNNGALLKTATFSMRDTINEVNNDILEYTAAEANLNESFKRAVNNIALTQKVNTALQECRSLTGGTEKSVECLNKAQQEVEALSSKLSANTPPSESNWENEPKNWLQQAADTVAGAGDALSAGLSSAITGFATVVLLALCNAYQWGVEFSMLLTALLGPMAVGASLLPYGNKQIFALLKAFFSLGMAKLSFNIILGLCGQLVSNAEQNQPMIFLLFIGLISPLIATGIAAGGGIAIFGAVSQAAAAGTGATAQVFSAGSNSMGKTINNGRSSAVSKENNAGTAIRHAQTIAAIKSSK